MFVWLVGMVIFSACEQHVVSKSIETTTKTTVAESSPYRHFEVTGLLKTIEMKQINSDSAPPYLYTVSKLCAREI